MNRPFFNRWLDHLREELAQLPDRRRGTNKSYAMENFGRSAFAVFFTQSPSFVAHQKAMREQRGCDNAQSLFGITRIPCDNQVRQMLDPVPPQVLHPLFDRVLDAVREAGMLEEFHGVVGRAPGIGSLVVDNRHSGNWLGTRLRRNSSPGRHRIPSRNSRSRPRYRRKRRLSG